MKGGTGKHGVTKRMDERHAGKIKMLLMVSLKNGFSKKVYNSKKTGLLLSIKQV